MGFQGSLKDLTLPEIIEVLSASAKTGLLRLESGAEWGQIYVRGGQIAHVQTRRLEGEEGLYQIASWVEGNFLFSHGIESERTTIERTNTHLLMEAARRIDEWKVLSRRIPSLDAVPVFVETHPLRTVSLKAEQWTVIRKIDEQRSIRHLALALGMSPFEVCKILDGMIRAELIEVRDGVSGASVEEPLRLDSNAA